MNRFRLLFILGFLVSMSAGVVVGMVARTVAGRGPKDTSVVSPPTTQHSLEADLKLEPRQAEEVHQIWSQVFAAVRQLDQSRGEKRQALDRERDEQIAQLLFADQVADYDWILQEHELKVAELRKDRDKLFQDAEQKMRPLLSDAQWKRYEEIKKERADHRHNGRPSGGRGGGRPTSSKSTTSESQDKPH